MNNINFWALVLATLVGFGLSSIWYSPFLFGQEWMSLRKIDDKSFEWLRNNGLIYRYLAIFLANLVTFGVLAFMIVQAEAVGATDGAFLGLLAWLGFIVPVTLSGLVWRRESFNLFLIESVGYLINLVVGGAILGWWN